MIYAQRAVCGRRQTARSIRASPALLVDAHGRRARAAAARPSCAARSTKPRPTPTSTSSASTSPSDEAKGQSGQNQNDDPGWFFVIKQRPGEPRFGLELEPTLPTTIFDQLDWDAAPASAAAPSCPAGALAPAALSPASPANPDIDQHNDDVVVNTASPSAARWAYLLFRAPVLVAVHADELLS